MLTNSATQDIELWPIARLVEYPREPRKNDAAVGRMCASIREFGFKIPCLVRRRAPDHPECWGWCKRNRSWLARGVRIGWFAATGRKCMSGVQPT